MSLNKPSDPVIIEFLKWTLTTGQKIAAKFGYSQLRQCQVEASIKILEELPQNQ